MFTELQEFFRGMITTSVAGVQLAREHHKDALEREQINENLRREEMERTRTTRERMLAHEERLAVAQERAAAAWERVALALETIADKT